MAGVSQAVASQAVGEVRADCVYQLDELKTRTGLGTAALRTARRRGLRVRKIGRKGFVLGADFLAYVQSAAATS